jgi:hypothetical protein
MTTKKGNSIFGLAWPTVLFAKSNLKRSYFPKQRETPSADMMFELKIKHF